MSPVFIIFCIIGFLIPVGLCVYYKEKVHDQHTEIDILHRRNQTLEERFEQEDAQQSSATSQPQPAIDFLHEVAAKNQFTITEFERDEDWVTCGFEYQGGNFLCYAGAKNDELLLQFRGIADCPYTPENYEKVRTLCHRMTRQYRYGKLVYSFNDEENNLYLHILIETIGPSKASFMHFLNLCFQLAHEARQQLTQESATTEEEMLDAERDAQMLVDAEMAHERDVHSQKYPRRSTPESGTLGEYINYLFNGEKVEDLLSLTIQNGKGTQDISQRDKIAGFDILSAIISGTGEDASFIGSAPAVLTVDAVTNHYVFTLHPLSGGKNVLSVRMTAVCTPHEFLQTYVPDATYEPQAISMRLCYVKTELPAADTEEDEELPQTNMGAQVKHGHKLLQQQCYLQAIAVLTPVFWQLERRFLKLSESERAMYFRVCFLLGFSYNDLHRFEKARFYLSRAHEYNRFDYSQEYINCLANSADHSVFPVIAKEQEEVRKQIDDIDKDDDRGTERMMQHRERLIDYYAFLQRRQAYSLINFGYLDDAENIFRELLDHEGSREYAEGELKYIEQLRANNHETKEETPEKNPKAMPPTA